MGVNLRVALRVQQLGKHVIAGAGLGGASLPSARVAAGVGAESGDGRREEKGGRRGGRRSERERRAEAIRLGVGTAGDKSSQPGAAGRRKVATWGNQGPARERVG